VCNVAPIPGETKVWQYISLMNRIYLIDCPGVVQPGPEESQTSIVLKGVVRIEGLVNPEEHIAELLKRVKKEYLVKTYGVDGEWEDELDFLAQLARLTGKLNKGGEPDLHTVAKMVLGDWVRGNIPYYSQPPARNGEFDTGVGEKIEEVEGEDKVVAEEVTEEATVEAKIVELEE
jgi:nuclear GTP-binding protein